jgi:26S proteasome regulatory subunit N2
MISQCFSPALLVGMTNNLKVPVFDIKCNAKPSQFEYHPHITTGENDKAKETKSAVLSTTSKVKSRLERKQGLSRLVSKMAEEKKEEAEKMEEEKPAAKPAEEPNFTILKNPCRVLPLQQEFIEFLEDSRYQPIIVKYFSVSKSNK